MIEYTSKNSCAERFAVIKLRHSAHAEGDNRDSLSQFGRAFVWRWQHTTTKLLADDFARFIPWAITQEDCVWSQHLCAIRRGDEMFRFLVFSSRSALRDLQYHCNRV